MKLEYENKVNLITSPLPRKNKVTADDLNDIKEVVNKNAGDLLWENESPTSGMAEDTTIELDLSEYQSVRIIFKVNATTTTMGESRYVQREIEVGYRSNVDHITPFANQANVVIRQRTFIVDTEGITFAYGSNHTIGTNNSYTVPDVNALIPVKIYGVR
jgi:hypothetical protein